jgi:spermidine/putrescine transport system substrate-binding protein
MEATGIDMRYSEAFNDNVEYFAKIQPRARPWRPDRARPHRPDELDGRPPHQPRLARPAARRSGPQRRQPPRRPREPRLGPDRRVLLPWQTGFAGIAYNIDVTGRELTSVDDLWDPEFAGKIGALTEMRDTIGVIAAQPGRRHLDARDLRRGCAGVRAARAGQGRRPDPPLPRQRLLRRLCQRQLRRHHRLVGRRRPDPARQPGRPLPVPRVRGDELGRHHGDAEGRRQPRRRRAVDELRLRPGAGGPDHGLGAVRVAGEGRARGGREDRSGARDNPLIFPDDATLAATRSFASLSEDVEAEYDAAFSRIIGA